MKRQAIDILLLEKTIQTVILYLGMLKCIALLLLLGQHLPTLSLNRKCGERSGFFSSKYIYISILEDNCPPSLSNVPFMWVC